MTQSPAPAINDVPKTTVVGPPRQRIFLPQSGRQNAVSYLWRLTWNLLAGWTPGWLNMWRVLLLRCFGATIGRGTVVHRTTKFFLPWNLTLADHVVIADHVIINAMGPITIGQRTRISQYSHLCSGTHDYQDPKMGVHQHPITIGKDVWLAADVFVGPNVTIGDRTIVGARSGVFANLPSGVIAVGLPCKTLRKCET